MFILWKKEIKNRYWVDILFYSLYDYFLVLGSFGKIIGLVVIGEMFRKISVVIFIVWRDNI